MSDIENINGDFQAMTAGLAAARDRAAAALGRADEVIAQAAQAGFAGIAAGMTTVRTAIGEIRTAVADLHGQVREAATLVAQAPKEITPEETIRMLTPAGQALATARNGLSACIGRIAGAQRLAAAALRGGQPAPIIAALDGVKHAVAQVEQRRQVAKQQVEKAIAAAGRVGAAGN